MKSPNRIEDLLLEILLLLKKNPHGILRSEIIRSLTAQGVRKTQINLALEFLIRKNEIIVESRTEKCFPKPREKKPRITGGTQKVILLQPEHIKNLHSLAKEICDVTLLK